MAYNNYSYNPYVNPYAQYQPQSQMNIQPNFISQQPQNQMFQQQQNSNGFVWVDGIEEAKNYFVAPNSAVQLWDKNLPCIYKKSADAAGKPYMQVFDLVERKCTTEPENAIEGVLDPFKSKVENLEKIVKTLEDRLSAIERKEREVMNSGESVLSTAE